MCCRPSQLSMADLGPWLARPNNAAPQDQWKARGKFPKKGASSFAYSTSGCTTLGMIAGHPFKMRLGGPPNGEAAIRQVTPPSKPLHKGKGKDSTEKPESTFSPTVAGNSSPGPTPTPPCPEPEPSKQNKEDVTPDSNAPKVLDLRVKASNKTSKVALQQEQAQGGVAGTSKESETAGIAPTVTSVEVQTILTQDAAMDKYEGFPVGDFIEAIVTSMMPFVKTVAGSFDALKASILYLVRIVDETHKKSGAMEQMIKDYRKQSTANWDRVCKALYKDTTCASTAFSRLEEVNQMVRDIRNVEISVDVLSEPFDQVVNEVKKSAGKIDSNAKDISTIIEMVSKINSKEVKEVGGELDALKKIENAIQANHDSLNSSNNNMMSAINSLNGTCENKFNQALQMGTQMMASIEGMGSLANQCKRAGEENVHLKPWNPDTFEVPECIRKKADLILNGRCPDGHNLSSEDIAVFNKIFDLAGLQASLKPDFLQTLVKNLKRGRDKGNAYWNTLPTQKMEATFESLYTCFSYQWFAYKQCQKVRFIKDALTAIAYNKLPCNKLGLPYTIDVIVLQGPAQTYNQALRNRTNLEYQTCSAAQFLSKVCSTWKQCQDIGFDAEKKKKTMNELLNDQEHVGNMRAPPPDAHAHPSTSHPPPTACLNLPPPPSYVPYSHRHDPNYQQSEAGKSVDTDCKTVYDCKTSHLVDDRGSGAPLKAPKRKMKEEPHIRQINKRPRSSRSRWDTK